MTERSNAGEARTRGSSVSSKHYTTEKLRSLPDGLLVESIAFVSSQYVSVKPMIADLFCLLCVFFPDIVARPFVLVFVVLMTNIQNIFCVFVCLFVWCLTTHQPLWVISVRRY